MAKTKVIDTNVLMYDPKSLMAFGDSEIVIPLVVLDELDKKKDGPDQAAKHARMSIRMLDEMRSLGNLHEGVYTEKGGKIRVELNCKDYIPADLDPNRMDNRIISVALALIEKGQDVVIITKDLNLRVKANALNVAAEDYNSDAVVDSLDEMYKGYSDLQVPDDVINKLFADGSASFDSVSLYPNEYVQMFSESNPQHMALARYNGSFFEKIKYPKNTWGMGPKNREQKFLMDALFNSNIKLVTVSGAAGVGKTIISLLAAVSQLLDDKAYKKITITRPVQSVGKDLGYLPGTLDEKLNPWMVPIYDNLDLIFSDKGRNFVEGLKEEGKIEIEALSYIRGRSINEAFMIVDECLTKDHIISMSDGSFKKIQDIKKSDMVMSLNLVSNKMENNEVEGTIKRITDKTIKVETTLSVLECTENHPLYVFKNFCHTKKQVKDIVVGEFIISPRKSNCLFEDDHKMSIPVGEILLNRMKAKCGGLLHDRIYGLVNVCRHDINSQYKEFFTQEELEFINSFDFNEIKKIEMCDKECEVYDFKVANTGTFCVNGLISSNCQNLSKHEVKTILTRAGFGTKVVLTGDVEQIDNQYLDYSCNGLSYTIEKFKEQNIAAHITLSKGERSELATLSSKLL